MTAALFDPAHYVANPASIGPLATSFAIGLLCIIVLVREAMARAGRALLLLTNAASLWLGAFGGVGLGLDIVKTFTNLMAAKSPSKAVPVMVRNSRFGYCGMLRATRLKRPRLRIHLLR